MSDVHIPVMLTEVLEYMAPQDNGIYVDGTFGAGGYARGLLDKANCKVIGIDRDAAILALAQNWAPQYGSRLQIVNGRFSLVAEILKELGLEQVDGFVLDIGVSSYQLDTAERGFSFRFDDAPLDMRMNRDDPVDAASIVNHADEEDLANMIYEYGEEKMSRRIARAIVEARKREKFETTGQLASIVRAVVPFSKKDKSDPATRTFQALRIAVNKELQELKDALEAALTILKPGGRLVVVSFHSLEDRIVKNFLNEKAGKLANLSRYLPPPSPLGQQDSVAPSLNILTRKPVTATEAEIARNPRARSAILRAAEKLQMRGAA
ncbi:MAG: 16S rRNA (cytosine(1402)-N(4))-methyltransferase RsmH [Alphaproteobacteria bacterium]|nr:16S rRNA (cytosine(1402)-N(4))-methyltransferase RsmH [Alphaproteobacteria bacterium]